jgi:hypothetical protein
VAVHNTHHRHGIDSSANLSVVDEIELSRGTSIGQPKDPGDIQGECYRLLHLAK